MIIRSGQPWLGLPDSGEERPVGGMGDLNAFPSLWIPMINCFDHL
jgi:hypothetical protein